jgi:hypothetical protein
MPIWPPAFQFQDFTPVTVPENGSENDRIAAALEWNHRFSLYYAVDDAARITISYYGADAGAPFEADEFLLSSTRQDDLVTLTIKHTGKIESMKSIEIMPEVDGDLETIASEPGQRVFRCRGDYGSLIRLGFNISDLDIRQIRGASPEIEVEGFPPVNFGATLSPRLENKDRFRIDKVSREQNLLSLLGDAFSLILAGCKDLEVGVNCQYTYSIGPSLPDAVVPVLKMPSRPANDLDEIVAGLADHLEKWTAQAAPSETGSFVFDVSADSNPAGSSESLRIFRLQSLILPRESFREGHSG